MTEQDFHDEAMDALLRRSLGGPAPDLSPDFDRRLKRALHPPTFPHRFVRRLLGTYALVSLIVSLTILHTQGLSWSLTAPLVLIPLVLGMAPLMVRKPTTHRIHTP